MSPRSICVIGAGGAGLCAAKWARRDGHSVVVYEQTDQLGGTWVYKPNSSSGGGGGDDGTVHHSAMYEHMRTNLPRQVMAFPEQPFPSDLPSFIRHEDVLDYLRDYGRGIPIEFNTTVTRIRRVDDDDQWEVATIRRNSSDESTRRFDVVFVCNGHYFQPLGEVDLSVVDENVEILHSHDYRSARPFTGKRVALIGCGPSAIDIALQIAEVAEKVILIRRGGGKPLPAMPENVDQLCGGDDASLVAISRLNEMKNQLRSVTSRLSIDALIDCTGYRYSFPFLDKDLVEVIVTPLYEHMVHARYPTSLFFIGLNFTVVPFVLFQYQMDYALGLIEGRVSPPNDDEMRVWHSNRLSELESRHIPRRHFHMLADDQWDHFLKLSKLAGRSSLQHRGSVQIIYDAVKAERASNPAGYKSKEYDDDDDEIEHTASPPHI